MRALPYGIATTDALRSLCRKQMVAVLHALPLKPGPTGFNNDASLPLVQFANTSEACAAENGFVRAAEAAATEVAHKAEAAARATLGIL